MGAQRIWHKLTLHWDLFVHCKLLCTGGVTQLWILQCLRHKIEHHIIIIIELLNLLFLINFPFITKPLIFRKSQNKIKYLTTFHLPPSSVVKQVTPLFSYTLQAHELLCYAELHNAPLCISIAMEPKHWWLYRANWCLKAYWGGCLHNMKALPEPAYTVDNEEAW